MPKTVEKYFNLKQLWKEIDILPKDRKYIAGGTDILISLNYGLDSSSCWIDISDIKELNQIKEIGAKLFIGSAVKISSLSKNQAVKKWAPALIKAIPYYASPSIRNMATLGGNYANASPCADGVCAMAATGAQVVLNLKNKKRILPLLSIIKGPKKIALKKDELIEGFILNKWQHKALFYKMMARRLFGISKATLCLCYKKEKEIITDLNISLASVGPKILIAEKTASFLRNKKIDNAAIEEACKIIKNEIAPIDDLRSNADYRREIIAVFLKRALGEIMEDR
jgi:carbon-monoxide dehydrogenase medium subunit